MGHFVEYSLSHGMMQSLWKAWEHGRMVSRSPSQNSAGRTAHGLLGRRGGEGRRLGRQADRGTLAGVGSDRVRQPQPPRLLYTRALCDASRGWGEPSPSHALRGPSHRRPRPCALLWAAEPAPC
jgi:hypothetical protein